MAECACTTCNLNRIKEELEKLSAENGLFAVHGTITNNKAVTVDLDTDVNWSEIMKFVGKTDTPLLLIESETVDEYDLKHLKSHEVVDEIDSVSGEQPLKKTPNKRKELKNIKVGDIFSLRIGVIVGQVFMQQQFHTEWSSAIIFDFNDENVDS